MLAVLTTHPIQYQVPVWKGLAARKNIPFKVFYMSDQGLEARFDPGFGKSLSWDIDLLGGYESEFLDTYRGPRLDSFWSLRLKRWLWARTSPDGCGRALDPGLAGSSLLAGRVRSATGRYRGVAARGNERAQQCGPDRGDNSNAGCCANCCAVSTDFCTSARPIGNSTWNRVSGRSGSRPHPIVWTIIDLPLPPRLLAPSVTAFARNGGSQRRRSAFCLRGNFSPKSVHLISLKPRGVFSTRFRERKYICCGSGRASLAMSSDKPVMCASMQEARERVNAPNGRNGPNASFVGFLNQSEISRAYVAADCLVLPSDARETWGLVVNEAMASGLPCIVSDACGCAEDLVKPIRPDLCYPVGDIIALERAMAAAITNTPPPRALGSAHFQVRC